MIMNAITETNVPPQKAYSKDRVKIEAYILTGFGWSQDPVWVPREVALSESQDEFLAWTYSDDGESWRDTWGDVRAVFVCNFSFDADESGDDSHFVEKGTRVKIVCNPPPGQPAIFSGSLGEHGVMQECGRIGDGAGWDVYDVLLDNGNEISCYGFQLEQE
jgi:hypothetical protein